MLEIKYTAQARRDLKKLASQNKDLSKLAFVLNLLAAGKTLPAKNRDHALRGGHTGHRECHVEPDWLLIYTVNNLALVLTAIRTGSHSELFG